MVEPIRYAKLRITGDGSLRHGPGTGTSVQDETGRELPVEALRLEIDAKTGEASLWLKLAQPDLELDLDLTPVEKRAYESKLAMGEHDGSG